MKFKLIIVFFALLPSQLWAQHSGKSSLKNSIGAELQIYPTGLLPGLRYERYMSDNWSLDFRAALQFIDHRDLGKLDDEKGKGYGGSIGLRKYLTSFDSGLALTLRLDYWRNTIDWEETDPIEDKGTTKISVLQPTLMGEYIFKIGETTRLIPSLALGWEWNVKTDGEPTGEGPIVLIGISVMKGF